MTNVIKNVKCENKKIKAGVILVSKWGCGQTLVDFYKVTKITDCYAWVIEIESMWLPKDDEYIDLVTPGQRCIAKLRRRKILESDVMGEYVSVGFHSNAYIFNGEPVRKTDSRYGR